MDIILEPGVEYKLYELLGTKYMIVYFTPKLNELFKKCEDIYEETGKRVTIDLCHCKFNPDNHVSVVNYKKFIKFIDSDNPIINNMLEHNDRVDKIKELEKSGYIKIEDIPAVMQGSEMIGYVSNLDKSKVYRVKSTGELNGKPREISVLIAMIINYMYPNIGVDISEQVNSYFKLFNKFWMYTGEIQRDSYNISWQGNILKVNALPEKDKFGNNIFYVPGVGELTEETLNVNFEVIPYDFGSKILDPRKGGEYDPELTDIFEAICNEVQRLITKVNRKTLASELKTIDRR